MQFEYKYRNKTTANNKNNNKWLNTEIGIEFIEEHREKQDKDNALC